MKKKVVWIIGAVALIALIVVAYILYQVLGREYEPERLAVNSTASVQSGTASQAEKLKAPDFSVEDRQGTDVSLSDHLGKPVVVNFWASWCSPCKSEMPDFNEAFKQYGDEIAFMMVNLTDGSQETMQSALQYLDGQDFDFPVYFDTNANAAITYGVSSVPMTFFIDKDGNLVTYALGALDAENLNRGIQMILEG